MENPLLSNDQFPEFDAIRPEHVVPAVTQRLEESRHSIESLLDSVEKPDWDTLARPYEEAEDRLDRTWSTVGHLNAVRNTPEFRAAYEQCVPAVAAYRAELGQNEKLFRAFEGVATLPAFSGYPAPRRKCIENALRDFRLAGVALPEAQRGRFRRIVERLAELGNRFQNNVLDATQGWYRHLTDDTLLAGLPDSVRATLRAAATERGLAGYVVTLDFPSYQPVMRYADARSLREELYAAYMTRASELGPQGGRWDNSAVMDEILCLRAEMAQLLGFRNYAEYSLATKMAASPTEVVVFLEELAARSVARARAQFAELEEFAREHGVADLAAWDIGYFSEKLRQRDYGVSQEDYRPYFPLPRVLDGLFELVRRLFGVSAREVPGAKVWHPDVRLYELREREAPIAYFYLDPYARSGKRSGAWMDDCRIRRRLGDDRLQLPVAHLVCNFTPPDGAEPALLTHDEVTTLFHEFGHGLHHMLTEIEVPAVSGIRGVAWDAVELPSQIMENWCWEPDALAFLSAHVSTGQPLPRLMVDKLLRARNFQSAMLLVRQLEFALVDFRMHLHEDASRPPDLAGIVRETRAEIAAYPVPEYVRFAHAFSHVFSGGYAAGYYSYKWAEVLSADCFELFEERGVLDPETGQAFRREILAPGGSRDAAELFRAFRGRDPRIDALLRHSGITASDAEAA